MGQGLVELDHLAVTAPTLEIGVCWVEERLGVPLSPGGEHPAMGTHNRLLSLGPGEYLEVIAIDPAAPAPSRPRWFGLDDARSEARLAAWIMRVPDLVAALRDAPAGSGVPMALSRGDLAWQMAVPVSGALPFKGLAPALIRWESSAHPADRLPDQGIRLSGLSLRHPAPDDLRQALGGSLIDPRLSVERAPVPELRARFQTPDGERWL